MAATSEDSDRLPKHDHHFGYRTFNASHHDFDDALFYGARDALAAMAAAGDDRLNSLLDLLAADQHDGAQWLLYETLKVAGETHAQRAFEVLIEGEHRLYCGFTCSTWWTTRELVIAIAPWLRDDQLLALEEYLPGLSTRLGNRTGRLLVIHAALGPTG